MADLTLLLNNWNYFLYPLKFSAYFTWTLLRLTKVHKCFENENEQLYLALLYKTALLYQKNSTNYQNKYYRYKAFITVVYWRIIIGAGMQKARAADLKFSAFITI